MTPHRLPLQPLLDYCCAQHRIDKTVTFIGPIGIAAQHLGINRENLYRWAHRGVPWWTADQLAVKQLGVHPAHIWSEWHHHV